MQSNHPKLIGYSPNGTCELNSVQEVAEFICREGVHGEVEERRLSPPIPLHLPPVRRGSKGLQAQFFQFCHMTASFFSHYTYFF